MSLIRHLGRYCSQFYMLYDLSYSTSTSSSSKFRRTSSRSCCLTYQIFILPSGLVRPMGACLSCNQSSTHDHQEQNKTPPNKNKDSITPTTTTPSSSPPVNVSSSLGAGMRDGESVPHTNNHHHHHHRVHGNNSATTGTAASSTPNNQDGTSAASLKGDKKNFYSRIPPLGRVGSTSADKDKGPSSGGKTSSSSITIIK